MSNSKRTLLLVALAFAGTGLLACDKQAAEVESVSPASQQSAPPAAVNTEQVHQAIFTADTHIDIPITLGKPGSDPRVDGPMQVDIPKMRQGGLDLGFFIVYVGQGPVSDSGYRQAYQDAMDKFDAIDRMLTNSPDDLALVTTPDQARLAVAEGKIAVAIGVENAFPLGDNYQHLEQFHQRGARYISLTHFGHNHFGDSSMAKGDQDGIGEPHSEGLSQTGLSLIEEMNRLGIMVDVSHTSKASTLAAVAHSKVPVIASHSGVRELYDHPRNLTDEEIVAIADQGGVVHVVAFDSYMRSFSDENKQAVAEIRKDMGLTAADWYKTASQQTIGDFRKAVAGLHDLFPRATVADLVDGIEYVIKLVGVEHVGISSDFGGGGGVQGWDSIDQTPAITEELLKRGYSAEQIDLIWSGNLLRVWQAATDYAQSVP